MKIVFTGDSITHAFRIEEELNPLYLYGMGFARDVIGELVMEDPTAYEFVNTGICGNRSIDLYERIDRDLIDHNPDVISLLVGVNDVHAGIEECRGVDLMTYEKTLRKIIEKIQAKLPKVKIIILEPYITKGFLTEKEYGRYVEVYEYAKVVRRLAAEYKLNFVPLQEIINENCKKYGAKMIINDGIHPNILGAKLIAREWLKTFKTII